MTKHSPTHTNQAPGGDGPPPVPTTSEILAVIEAEEPLHAQRGQPGVNARAAGCGGVASIRSPHGPSASPSPPLGGGMRRR